jgi:trimeric autotransporter adhesin
MRRQGWIVGYVVLLGLLAGALPAQAQSDILLQLRSGSPQGDRMRVDSAGGFVFLGQLGIGIIPATGGGERTMWYPFKGAFRSGSAGGSGSTAWDDANIGFWSLAGGFESRAKGIYSFAMGNQNVADAQSSVALGNANVVHGTSPDFATGGVAMGLSSQVFKQGGVAVGWNATSGITGTPTGGGGQGAVAIGHQVVAQGDNTLALGNRVSTGGFHGTVVIGDRSVTSGVPIIANANNQFNVRAAGGVRLFTNFALTAGVTLSAGGSTWNPVSDVNRKEHFREVDGEDLLQRLRLVPVTTWRYRDEEDRTVRHMGPMAQDWHRVFDFGGDPLRINMGDMDGVNLAAVQALERRTGELRAAVEARDGQIQALEQRTAELEAKNTELERRLAGIEELLRQKP